MCDELLIPHFSFTSFLEESVNQVLSVDSSEFVDDFLSFGWFVPKEELTLREFVFRRFSGKDWLERVGMESCVPTFCAYGHGSGCEVLHLLQFEIQVLGDDSQFCHVFFGASWVAADEVRDELLVEVVLLVDLVEDALEVVEQLE